MLIWILVAGERFQVSVRQGEKGVPTKPIYYILSIGLIDITSMKKLSYFLAAFFRTPDSVSSSGMTSSATSQRKDPWIKKISPV